MTCFICHIGKPVTRIPTPLFPNSDSESVTGVNIVNPLSQWHHPLSQPAVVPLSPFWPPHPLEPPSYPTSLEFPNCTSNCLLTNLYSHPTHKQQQWLFPNYFLSLLSLQCLPKSVHCTMLESVKSEFQ